MTRIVMQTKACDCKSPGSGPRLKLYPDASVSGGTIGFILRVLPFACDRCDTPWTETSHFAEEQKQ